MCAWSNSSWKWKQTGKYDGIVYVYGVKNNRRAYIKERRRRFSRVRAYLYVRFTFVSRRAPPTVACVRDGYSTSYTFGRPIPNERDPCASCRVRVVPRARFKRPPLRVRGTIETPKRARIPLVRRGHLSQGRL